MLQKGLAYCVHHNHATLGLRNVHTIKDLSYFPTRVEIATKGDIPTDHACKREEIKTQSKQTYQMKTCNRGRKKPMRTRTHTHTNTNTNAHTHRCTLTRAHTHTPITWFAQALCFAVIVFCFYLTVGDNVRHDMFQFSEMFQCVGHQFSLLTVEGCISSAAAKRFNLCWIRHVQS